MWCHSEGAHYLKLERLMNEEQGSSSWVFQNVVLTYHRFFCFCGYIFCQILRKLHEQTARVSASLTNSQSPDKHPETQIYTLTTTSHFHVTSQPDSEHLSGEPWNEIMSSKGSRDWWWWGGGGCCCSVSVGTRCWLWLKEEVLLLNTAAPLHHEHYPLSNQRGPASKPAHYFPSYPNFLIWARLDGFLSSCAPTAEPKT